jgi:hypothetical protein
VCYHGRPNRARMNGTTPQHGVSNFGTVIPSLDEGVPTDSPQFSVFFECYLELCKELKLYSSSRDKACRCYLWIVFKIERQSKICPATKMGLVNRIDFKESSNSARIS